MSISLCIAGGLRANPPLADGSLHLTVANPSQTWQANRPLSLGESVQLSVTAEPAGRTSQQAPLLHLQSLRVTPSSLTKTIWIPVGPASIRALHLGQYENTFTAEISAVWVEQQAAGPGGGEGLSQLASQYGTARGTATSKNPSFSWTAVQPRHQFPDGSSSIQFAANGESNITGVTLSDSGYKVSTALGTLHGDSLNSAGGFAGELSSTAAGSTRLSITWTGQGVTKELSRSPELAFSNLDMKPKAGPGATQVLAEDRVKPTISPENPASNPDGHHEIDPGTFAFLLPSTATNVTRTEVTIVKQFSPTTPARAKLESHGLPSLVVSTDAEGNAPLSLPADWPNANAIPSTIYLHGTTDAQNPPLQKGTLALTLELELQDDAQTAPFSDQPSTQKSWHKIVEKIGVSLLPVEIKDVKGVGTGDDVFIQTSGTKIDRPTDAQIAFIEPHGSLNGGPMMPQIEAAISGGPSTLDVEWSLEVKYDRGNGSRIARNQPEDTVTFPTVTKKANEVWRVYQETSWTEQLSSNGFFGGHAVLKMKLGSTEQQFHFRIGGKNPEPARARQYIEGLTDCGPTGSLWFAYAIARSESKDYNGSRSRYNQFLRLPQNPRDNGFPLWGNDGGTRPGGYGMFQVTGNVQDSESNIPRAQIWNWQTNATAARVIIVDKRRAATNWMATQSNATHANGTAIPSHTTGNVTFDGTTYTLTHACTIKAYNGASKPATDTDGATITGFVVDPSYPSIGHYGYWHSGQNKWGLCRFNSLGFNYVLRVCEEVEP